MILLLGSPHIQFVADIFSQSLQSVSWPPWFQMSKLLSFKLVFPYKKGVTSLWIISIVFSLVCRSLIMVFLGRDFFGFILFGIRSAFQMQVYVFHHLGKFLDISLNFVFWSYFLLSLWGCVDMNINLLSQRYERPFFFPTLFSLLCILSKFYTLLSPQLSPFTFLICCFFSSIISFSFS